MCRYSDHDYKYHFACFACRKSFKRHPRYGKAPPCPQCLAPMKNMGRDFHVPRQADVKEWAKVQALVEGGVRFNSCGCGGPGYRPTKLWEVPKFLEQRKEPELWQKDAGWVLLREFERRGRGIFPKREPTQTGPLSRPRRWGPAPDVT